jgi:aminoacrylate hydrolase
MFHPLWLLPPDYVNVHDAEIDEERRRTAASASPVEVSIGRIDALLRFDRRAGLPDIKSPTLILAAQDDYITPCYHARVLANAIPGAQLELLDGGGHSISKTRTELFNQRVMNFLSG